MKKAVLYARAKKIDSVIESSMDEKQIKRLKDYCSAKGIEIIFIYNESNEFKRVNHAYGEYYDFMKKNHETIDIYFFATYESFTSDMLQAYFLVQNSKKWDVELHIIALPIMEEILITQLTKFKK